MLDPLVNPAQESLEKALTNRPELKNRNVHDTARITSESILQALSGEVLSGDTSGITELLSGRETTSESPVVQRLLPKVVMNLASRLGLSEGTARSIAMLALPVILNMLNGKVNRAEQQGVNIGGVLGGLLGGLSESTGGSHPNGNPPQSSPTGRGGLLGSLLDNLLRG